MVTDRIALTDALIEGGVRPDAARRVVDLLERDQAEVAKQAEVNQRLEEQDRRNEIRFKAIEDSISRLERHLNQRIDDLKDGMDGLRGGMDRQFAAMEQRFLAMEQRFRAMEQRFTLLLWLIALSAAVNFALFGWIISRLP